ncbi:thermonuclease family protein [Parahaliea mediterranea]|uniref:thermonuclease family protein n=1 Tax=Parahaliea mediterranea TaxID=651086 RepID=UPI000E2FE3BE|nr:thermonuclease family protein [Parahaliea mediterranea]
MHRLRYLLPGAIALLAACATSPEAPAPAPPANLQVGVSRVVEGDTLVVVDSDNQRHLVRLRGVDAPQPSQPFGEGARRCLEELVGGRSVRLSADMRSREQTLVSEVYLASRPVSQLLIQRGCAWWDTRSAPYDLELGRLESAARRARRGLWVDTNPVPPWEWQAGSGRP